MCKHQNRQAALASWIMYSDDILIMLASDVFLRSSDKFAERWHLNEGICGHESRDTKFIELRKHECGRRMILNSENRRRNGMKYRPLCKLRPIGVRRGRDILQ